MRGPNSPTSSGGGDSYHHGYPPPPQQNGYGDEHMRMREDERGGPPWRHPEAGYHHSPNTPSWHDSNR